MEMDPPSLSARFAWSRVFAQAVTAMSFLGSGFQQPLLVLGFADGALMSMSPQSPKDISDTADPQQDFKTLRPALQGKSSSVTALCLCDMLRAGTTDVVVGDAEGGVSLFSEGSISQLLCRHQLPSSLVAICAPADLHGTSMIVAGDIAGEIVAFNGQELLWQARISDFLGSADVGINCITSFSSKDDEGSYDYVVISSGPHILFYHGGKVLYRIDAPSNITALTALESKVLLCGGENGTIYAVKDFQLLPEPYAVVGAPIQGLLALKVAEVEVVVCNGLFPCLKFLYGGKCFASVSTPEWISKVVAGTGTDLYATTWNNEVLCYHLKSFATT